MDLIINHYHPACGHKGSSHLSPVHALQLFIAMQVQHSYNSSTNGSIISDRASSYRSFPRRFLYDTCTRTRTSSVLTRPIIPRIVPCQARLSPLRYPRHRGMRVADPWKFTLPECFQVVHRDRFIARCDIQFYHGL